MTEPPIDGHSQPVQAVIERLWLEGRTKSIERVTVIEEAVAALLLGELHDHRDAVSAAHKLAGTLGMFGLPGGSSVARQIEHSLERPELAEAELLALSDQVVGLRASIESAPDRPVATSPLVDRPTLHLVGSDRAYVEALSLGGECRGFDVRTSAGPESSIDWDAAAVVVFDCATVPPEAIPVAPDRSRGPLLVGVGAPTDLDVRLGLAERSVDLVVGADVAADEAIELIADELECRRRRLRVHVVGSPSVESGRPEISIADRPLIPLSVQELFGVAPRTGDLLVLDARTLTPRAAALWCRSIRASVGTRDVPLTVVLEPGSESDAGIGLLLAAGADDVATDCGAELAERLRSVSGRSSGRRSQSSEASVDAGIDSPIDFVDQRIETARREGQRLAVLFVAPANMVEVNERHGRDAGDELLAEVGKVVAGRFRPHDQAGRWGAGFVAVLGGDQMTVSDRLESLVGELKLSGIEAVAAVAVLGDDGSDGETLMEAAARRTRPASSGRHGGDPIRSDRAVLVVDDDPLIASLVTELLTSRGHRVEVVSDGPSAASLLSRSQAADDYKLVVLDVSLPGLDGFGVLRQMQRNRTTGEPPVVLLTARAAESEVLAGLDLGAVDHIAKPFSPLVLLRRLERALEG